MTVGGVVRRLGLTVAACAGLGFALNPMAPASSIDTRAAAVPPLLPEADTLRFTLAPGQPFLHALPERHRGQYVAYEPVELPALSWLQGRSLYWKTLPEQRGPHRLVLARTTLDAVADTVVLVVDLTAE
jgi:hypothetical protein